MKYGFWFWKPKSTPSYVQLLMGIHCSTYICVGHTKELQDLIREVVEQNPCEASNPFFIDTLIMDAVLSSYRTAISQNREVLRAIVSTYLAIWSDCQSRLFKATDRPFPVFRNKTKYHLGRVKQPESCMMFPCYGIQWERTLAIFNNIYAIFTDSPRTLISMGSVL